MNLSQSMIWRVFRYELFRQVRRGGFLFTTFGIPAIALLIFFGAQLIQRVQAAQGQRPAVDAAETVTAPTGINAPRGLIQLIGVVDLSGTVKKTNSPQLVLYADEAAAQQALQAQLINYYYRIERDYLKSGAVSMVFDRLQLSTIENRSLRRLLVQSLVEQSGQTVSPAVITRLQIAPTIQANTVASSGDIRQTGSEASNFALVYIFAVALMATAFTTSGYLMQSVVEEKETRMVEVLLSSLRPRDLLIGKVAALSTLGLVQMGIWFGAILFILNQVAGGAFPQLAAQFRFNLSATQIVMLIVYFILGYLLYAASFAAIGALVTSMREGPQFAAFVTLPAAVPLWATSIFASAPDSPFAVGLSMFPLTAPLAMVMRLTVTEVPLIQFLISAGLLACTVFGMMWLAGRFFRVNTLLSGQVPKLRDLARIVFDRS